METLRSLLQTAHSIHGAIEYFNLLYLIYLYGQHTIVAVAAFASWLIFNLWPDVSKPIKQCS